MRHVRQFFAFWYDFIVGDDWTVAAGTIAAFAVSAALVRAGVEAWWVMPLAAAALLAVSLRRAIRR